MDFILKLYCVSIVLLSCNCCGEVFLLEKHPSAEGKGRYLRKKEPLVLSPQFKKIDWLEIGEAEKSFPFVGIKAQFLVKIEEKNYILTMLETVNGYDKKTFHLSETISKGGKQFAIDLEHDYLRIFSDAQLWNFLNDKLKGRDPSK